MKERDGEREEREEREEIRAVLGRLFSKGYIIGQGKEQELESLHIECGKISRRKIETSSYTSEEEGGFLYAVRCPCPEKRGIILAGEREREREREREKSSTASNCAQGGGGGRREGVCPAIHYS